MYPLDENKQKDAARCPGLDTRLAGGFSGRRDVTGVRNRVGPVPEVRRFYRPLLYGPLISAVIYGGNRTAEETVALTMGQFGKRCWEAPFSGY